MKSHSVDGDDRPVSITLQAADGRVYAEVALGSCPVPILAKKWDFEGVMPVNAQVFEEVSFPEESTFTSWDCSL